MIGKIKKMHKPGQKRDLDAMRKKFFAEHENNL